MILIAQTHLYCLLSKRYNFKRLWQYVRLGGSAKIPMSSVMPVVFGAGVENDMNDPHPLSPALAGQFVVLIAEDELMICNIVRMTLEEMGVLVLTASDGEQALEFSRKFPGAIHALVSDTEMPNLDGLALCDQIRRERPETKLLLMSGSSGPANGISFLQKPFGVEELKQKMRQLLDGIALLPPA